MRWYEGPVYFGDACCVIWSDIPNNRLMRDDHVTGDAGAVNPVVPHRDAGRH
jgi:sugar lactone lactonase YvrE